MEPITAYRVSTIDLPWTECRRVLGAVLTSPEWSPERTRIVSRGQQLFAVAVRRVETAHESVLFRIIGDSPDVRHPVFGFVEIRPSSEGATSLTVMIAGNLDDVPARHHMAVREAVSGLADALGSTIVAAASPPTEAARARIVR